MPHTVTLTFHHTSDTVSINFDDQWDGAFYCSDVVWELIIKAHRELTYAFPNTSGSCTNCWNGQIPSRGPDGEPDSVECPECGGTGIAKT